MFRLGFMILINLWQGLFMIIILPTDMLTILQIKTIAKLFALTLVHQHALVTIGMISLATLHLECSLGVVITASHNPPSYNGYKLKGSFGLVETPRCLFLGANTQHVIKSESPLVADAVTLQRLTNTEIKNESKIF